MTSVMGPDPGAHESPKDYAKIAILESANERKEESTQNQNQDNHKPVLSNSDTQSKRLNFTLQKFIFTIFLTFIGGIADTLTYTTCGIFCGHITGTYIDRDIFIKLVKLTYVYIYIYIYTCLL